MIKKIISDQDGLYRNPFDAAVIKGDKTHTNFISKYVADPFVAISPYGAEVVPSGTPETTMRGDTIGEFSFNTNKMNYAQEGGASSQQQQIVQQQVAQMLQQGADPQQVMQQLVKMGIPSEQAEQLLTAVIQQMQAAMAEQEQMQNQDMGGQEQMPMAMYGGQEEFPQAQNLNWFYKMHGGEPCFDCFDNYNPSRQAQTYLPYDRGSKPAPNFMFQQGGDLDQYGGSTDIDQAYQIMQRGGFDMNPKKKKGGAFNKETFNEYLMRNGGNLPMHQWQNSQTGFGFGQPDATQVYRPNIQLNGLQQVPNQQQGKPNPFLINNQQSFANQYPGAMQNILNATRPMGQQTQPATTQSAAGARTAGSSSSVRRTTPANTPPAASVVRDNTPMAMITPPGPSQLPVNGDMEIQRNSIYNQSDQDDEMANFNKTKEEFARYNQNSEQKRKEAEARKAAELKKALSYSAGKGITRMFGPKTGAIAGLLGMGANAASGFGGLFGGKSKFKMNLGIPGNSRWDVKAKNDAANILAANLYGGFGQDNQQQGSQGNQNSNVYSQTGPNPNYIPYRMDQEDDPSKFATSGFMPPGLKKEGGDLSTYRFGDTTGDFKYTSRGPMFSNMDSGSNTSAFNSGVIDQAAASRAMQDYKKLYNKDSTTGGLFDLGAAEKGKGTINYAGYNAYNSGDQNFGYGNYPDQYLNNFRYGGNILDQYEDGEEVDLSDLTPEEQQYFIEQIMNAGGSVDYI